MSDKIATLAAELESIRSEIVELESVEEPTEEQANRAEELITVWDEKKAHHDRLVERAEKVEAVKRAALNPANVERAFSVPNVTVKRSAFEDLESVTRGAVDDSDLRARAMSALEETQSMALDSAHVERATRLVQRNSGIARHVLLTGSPEYHRAFTEWMRHPEAALESRQAHLLRTAMSNTNANGGYLLPTLLDSSIILTSDGSTNPFRQISRVETITTNKWMGVTSAGVTAEWKAEGSAAADASPTFGSVSVSALLGGAYVFGSYEVLSDTDFSSQLPRLIQDAKDNLEATAFATGAGSTTAPKGIVTAVTAVTASRVSPTTGGTFAAASEVYLVANAIPARHAARSAWVANKTITNAIRNFDTYGGGAFWTDLGMATPSQLLGQPVYEVSAMASSITTGSNILLAGDFSEYLIVDRVGISVEAIANVMDTSTGRPTGQRGFFAHWRTGADCLNANAFRVLKL